MPKLRKKSLPKIDLPFMLAGLRFRCDLDCACPCSVCLNHVSCSCCISVNVVTTTKPLYPFVPRKPHSARAGQRVASTCLFRLKQPQLLLSDLFCDDGDESDTRVLAEDGVNILIRHLTAAFPTLDFNNRELVCLLPRGSNYQTCGFNETGLEDLFQCYVAKNSCERVPECFSFGSSPMDEVPAVVSSTPRKEKSKPQVTSGPTHASTQQHTVSQIIVELNRLYDPAKFSFLSPAMRRGWAQLIDKSLADYHTFPPPTDSTVWGYDPAVASKTYQKALTVAKNTSSADSAASREQSDASRASASSSTSHGGVSRGAPQSRSSYLPHRDISSPDRPLLQAQPAAIKPAETLEIELSVSTNRVEHFTEEWNQHKAQNLLFLYHHPASSPLSTVALILYTLKALNLPQAERLVKCFSLSLLRDNKEYNVLDSQDLTHSVGQDKALSVRLHPVQRFVQLLCENGEHKAISQIRLSQIDLVSAHLTTRDSLLAFLLAKRAQFETALKAAKLDEASVDWNHAELQLWFKDRFVTILAHSPFPDLPHRVLTTEKFKIVLRKPPAVVGDMSGLFLSNTHLLSSASSLSVPPQPHLSAYITTYFSPPRMTHPTAVRGLTLTPPTPPTRQQNAAAQKFSDHIFQEDEFT
jgi:hypothetical protein